MRRVVFLSLIVLAGCGGDRRLDTVRYLCTDGSRITARYRPDDAVLWLSGFRVALGREPAASGTRYARGHLVWLTKGSEAILLDGGLSTGCRAVANG